MKEWAVIAKQCLQLSVRIGLACDSTVYEMDFLDYIPGKQL